MYGARMNGGDPDLLQKLMDKGNMGKKNKKGIFSYSGKDRLGTATVRKLFYKWHKIQGCNATIFASYYTYSLDLYKNITKSYNGQL